MNRDTTDGGVDEARDSLPEPMTNAIGDIHGEARLLRALLAHRPDLVRRLTVSAEHLK
jgi:hypothetical protein